MMKPISSIQSFNIEHGTTFINSSDKEVSLKNLIPIFAPKYTMV